MARGGGSSGVPGISANAMMDNEGGQFVADLIDQAERRTGQALTRSQVQGVFGDVARAGASGGRLSTSNINSIINSAF